jgi:hypothetical protein
MMAELQAKMAKKGHGKNDTRRKSSFRSKKQTCLNW